MTDHVIGNFGCEIEFELKNVNGFGMVSYKIIIVKLNVSRVRLQRTLAT